MRVKEEHELAELLAERSEPLSILGGGTRGFAGGHEPLDLSDLAGITLYEPGALTLVARAGTRLSDVEALLATEGQRLAFEPADWRGLLGRGGAPTLGGMVAANISGPRRVLAGAARDALLGVRFVDGTGLVVKNGGRVMKNVTGYDLARLMAGSWGTLAVLSEVALKVQPSPETEASLCLAGLSVAASVEAMTTALGSPWEVSGAARMVDGTTVIRVEGFEESVRYRTGRLSAVLAHFGPPEIVADAARSAAIWRDVRDVAAFHGREGDVWRVSLPPSDAAAVAARLGGELMLDWGGALLWVLLAGGTDARELAAPYRGHATLVRPDRATSRPPIRRFQPEAPNVAALAAGLRRRFDPRGILNPGLMG
jgi:glycolate oxidase FAD binding subunit